MQTRLLKSNETPPMNLLLSADPSIKNIKTYLNDGQCYIAEQDHQVLGVYVLKEIQSEVIELINIAVDGKNQGKGLGKELVMDAIKKGQAMGYRFIEVGTGNSSLRQLALYQKCGFRITGIETNFFIRNYDDEIFENGIQCRDMIRLSREL